MDCILEKDNVIVKFDKHLDMTSIQDAFIMLKKAFDYNKPILLQVNEITRLDTAGLQLLLSFYLAAHEKKITIQWEAPSAILVEIAKILNLYKLLKLSL